MLNISSPNFPSYKDLSLLSSGSNIQSAIRKEEETAFPSAQSSNEGISVKECLLSDKNSLSCKAANSMSEENDVRGC